MLDAVGVFVMFGWFFGCGVVSIIVSVGFGWAGCYFVFDVFEVRVF